MNGEHDLGVGPIPVSPRDLGGVHRAPCPRCGAETTPGVPACAACGHAPSIDPGLNDPSLRRPRRTRPARCRGCGYSLAGLRADTCPECGKAATLPSRREWDQATSREVAQRAYLQAAFVAAGGVGLGILVRTASAGWFAGAIFAGGWLGSSAIGIAVLLACGAIWMGFSSSVPLAMAQVAAAHAAALGSGVFVMTATGMTSAAMVVGAGLYFALMEWFLDLDPFDARCVGGLCAAVHVLAAAAAHALGLI